MAAGKLFSWLKGTKKSWTTNRRRSTVRLGLEALEDRLVPAVITVSTVTDVDDGDLKQDRKSTRLNSSH